MYKIFLCLILISCSHYNEVEAGINLEIPNPIIPINFGINLKLKDRISEDSDDEINKFLDMLIGNNILDKWMLGDKGKRLGNNREPQESNGGNSQASG